MGNLGVLAPRDAPPLGVRSCLLCSSCEEVIWRHGLLRVQCSFQGVHLRPDEGCARFSFCPENLGDEGAEDGLGEIGRKPAKTGNPGGASG